MLISNYNCGGSPQRKNAKTVDAFLPRHWAVDAAEKQLQENFVFFVRTAKSNDCNTTQLKENTSRTFCCL